MWNKRDDEPIRPGTAPQVAAPSPSPATGERREQAVIGASISVVGDVTGGEDLTILGKVEGKIALPKHIVTVGQSGRISADIQAKVVSVAGEVRGNLVASEQIVIRKTATMLGNLTAPRVGLEDGCCFRGSVEMESQEKPGTAAAQTAGSPSAPGVKAKPDTPLLHP